MGWCSKKVPELLPWPVCVLMVAPGLDGVVFQKLGWCSKKLSKNPRLGGVPKVGVVFQNVVPEFPLCILLALSIKLTVEEKEDKKEDHP